jgi:hypothetical protein
MPLLDELQKLAKAIAGAVVAAISVVATTTVTDPNAVVNPDAPDGANQLVQLPNTQAEWVTFVLALAVGFALPYLKRNFPSVTEANRIVALANKRVAEGKQSE